MLFLFVFFVKNNNSSFIFALLSQIAEDTITDCRGHYHILQRTLSIITSNIYTRLAVCNCSSFTIRPRGFTISSDGYVFNMGESFQDYS